MVESGLENCANYLTASICRDFGYVARDTQTRKHMCHVFRCDVPARAVARALLESHQKERREKVQRRNESSTAAAQEGRKSDSTEGSSGEYFERFL